MRRLAAALSAAALLAAGPEPASLAVFHQGSWRTFWRSDRPPARWAGADPSLVGALRWHRVASGIEWCSLRISCAAPVWRSKLIVVRLDPREAALTLDLDLSREDARPAWNLERAPKDALLAVNAGQFVGAMPWGWVVIDGKQHLRPGSGPLASAIAIDAQGRVRWSHGAPFPESPDIVTGFQSYPTLLSGHGVIPRELRTPGSGVSLTHRDARLALGETRDGRLLIVMTRFDAIGGAIGGFPLGPTTPEMAAIMGALGASDAVMLDGGISAQMLLRDATGQHHLEWHGLRKVPLALIVRERQRISSSDGR